MFKRKTGTKKIVGWIRPIAGLKGPWRLLPAAAAALLGVFLLLGIAGFARTQSFLSRVTDSYIPWTASKEAYQEALAGRFLGRGVVLRIFTIAPKTHYWTIINELKVDIDTIVGCNPYLNSFQAVVGEKIACVDRKGALHYVRGGETLGALSKLYNVPAREIRRFNRLSLSGGFRKGDVLFIPGARPRVMTERMNATYAKRKLFAVPTNGWVASRPFGMRVNPFTGKMAFHKGIDMKAGEGTPIFASADGTVTCAGPASGYGNLIMIDHGNGYTTYYGHCSRIFVHVGQVVKKRTCIGRVGDTGLATVAHLHFEIRSNSRPVDPLKFLW
jgi:hypothetical protein